MTMDSVRTKIEERLRAAFDEVLTVAAQLVEEAINDHRDDLTEIFMRDKALSVSLGLSVEVGDGGKINIGLTTGYTKEKVKEKTSAAVDPGQMRLPGIEQGETTVTITTADGQSATGSLKDLAEGVAKIKAKKKAG